MKILKFAALYGVSSRVLILGDCHHNSDAAKDEPARVGISDERFVHGGEDYFSAMDEGVFLSPDGIKGRNMWLVWSGGNDRFWDRMGTPTLGAFDLLKIVAPTPDSPLRRATRWNWLGVVNEPCFHAPPGPANDRFGLWLDVRDCSCPADPFADEKKYPAVKIGALGSRLRDGRILPVGSCYGWPAGIVGLRLFPDPGFDRTAAKAWDPVRYDEDPNSYTDPALMKSYRVVVDASIVPRIPGYFIVSAVSMAAERPAEMILEDARASFQTRTAEAA